MAAARSWPTSLSSDCFSRSPPRHGGPAMHSTIRRLHTVIMGGFVLVALTLGYWQFFRRDDLVARPTNPRLVEEARRVVRGRILDRNGEVLVQSKETPDGTVRGYAAPGLAHVTGYHSVRYGNSDVEAVYDDYLRGERSADPLERLSSSLFHRRTVGSDITLTIDARIQQAALDAMGGNNGAIVALDPKTGAVLALASQPTFDP